MGMGGVPNRRPVGGPPAQQRERDVLLNSNPDFELPIQGRGGRLRAGSRGQREPGMIPGIEPGAGRYPGGAF